MFYKDITFALHEAVKLENKAAVIKLIEHGASTRLIDRVVYAKDASALLIIVLRTISTRLILQLEDAVYLC